ncbi:hypothetical protein [Streptomyces sp. MMS24-I29]|uniref:hypothetical protein n=1 Tax=Streptomyces sp. MMS24-I29 TaxID=3351480 RepID=UPI003C7B7BB1
MQACYGAAQPLPVAGHHIGVLAPVGAQQVAVVGAVRETDPAFSDGLPPYRQQFQVVAAGQWDGYVPGGRRGNSTELFGEF